MEMIWCNLNCSNILIAQGANFKKGVQSLETDNNRIKNNEKDANRLIKVYLKINDHIIFEKGTFVNFHSTQFKFWPKAQRHIYIIFQNSIYNYFRDVAKLSVFQVFVYLNNIVLKL